MTTIDVEAICGTCGRVDFGDADNSELALTFHLPIAKAKGINALVHAYNAICDGVDVAVVALPEPGRDMDDNLSWDDPAGAFSIWIDPDTSLDNHVRLQVDESLYTPEAAIGFGAAFAAAGTKALELKEDRA